MDARAPKRGWKAGVAAVVVVLGLYVITDLQWQYGPLGRWVGSADADEATAPLYITSIPDSAQVYVNNELVGTTPYLYEKFDPGILRIRLEHEGLAPVETVFIVKENAPPPVLLPFVFSMHVDLLSVPEGGQPIVNGRPLRPYEAVNFNMSASETVAVAFELDGERSTSSVRLNPVKGLVAGDTTLWRWRGPGAAGAAALVGVFARRIYFSSEPRGADVYLDDQSAPIGQTNALIDVPYGPHLVTFVRAPFRDYRLPLSVSKDAPDSCVALLRRVVRFTAIAADDSTVDLAARVVWIRGGETDIKTARDHLQTPASFELDGKPYWVRFECKGYADTTVVLAADAGELAVAMRSLQAEHVPALAAAAQPEARVQFVVNAGRHKPVAGAEVIGVEKSNGNVVRYGPTDAAGELLAQVPVGDYKWQAAKEGFTGKTNGERIKPGKKPKKIALKMKPRR
jgi:hypothetical protein